MQGNKNKTYLQIPIKLCIHATNLLDLQQTTRLMRLSKFCAIGLKPATDVLNLLLTDVLTDLFNL